MFSPTDVGHLKTAVVAAIAYTAVVLGVGVAVGVWIETPPKASGITTTVQPEVRLGLGNVIAARVPVEKAQPAVPAPAGAKVTGTAVVVVRPKPLKQSVQFANLRKLTGSASSGNTPAPVCSCEPVRVDVTTFKDATGERWQFSSPNGDIVSATQHPVLSEIAGEPYRNALGLTWRPERGGQAAYGLLYQRDVFQRLRAGVKVEYEKQTGLQGELQALLRF